MRLVLDSIAVTHHTITRIDELEFSVDRSIKQAVATQAPGCFILSPPLAGGEGGRAAAVRLLLAAPAAGGEVFPKGGPSQPTAPRAGAGGRIVLRGAHLPNT